MLGYPLEPHKMVRTAAGVAEVMPEMVLSATLCCGCGICESRCPYELPIRQMLKRAAEVMGK